MKDLIALFTVGGERVTRLTRGFPNTEESLRSFGRIVATKNPRKAYYLFQVRESDWRRRPTPLFKWHVGEGFSHHQGWWVDP